MKETILLLPNQLFEKKYKNAKIYLYEHPVFFTKYNYHKKKLAYHRATMKSYANYLEKECKCDVEYVEFRTEPETLYKKFKNSNITIYDPCDFDILHELENYRKNIT